VERGLILQGQPTQIHGHAPAGVSLSPDQVRAFQAFLREYRSKESVPVTVVDALPLPCEGVQGDVQRVGNADGSPETRLALAGQQPGDAPMRQPGT